MAVATDFLLLFDRSKSRKEEKKKKMVLNERESRHELVLNVARGMMGAARTAPKGKGVDNLDIATISGAENLRLLAEKMRAMSEVNGLKFFLRDALNVEQSDAVVVIGTRLGIFSLNCGMCGFATCAEKLRHPKIPCALNMIDLGIALGSAVSYAADHRIDNRIMYSAGAAAQELGWVSDCRGTIAIVLSCNSKNPFFDRTAHKPEAEKP